MHDESQLVNLLQSRNKEGMNSLYDNYSHSLFGVIYKVVDNQELAEDVLQDCFVKIWQKIDSYDSSKGRLFTWMLNIARNLAIDVRRSKSFKKSQKVQSIDNDVYKNSAQVEAINVDTIGITEIVEKLDEKYKVLVDLVYFQGYTQKEVSEELEIPLGTVKTRIKSAMNILKEIVN